MTISGAQPSVESESESPFVRIPWWNGATGIVDQEQCQCWQERWDSLLVWWGMLVVGGQHNPQLSLKLYKVETAPTNFSVGHASQRIYGRILLIAFSQHHHYPLPLPGNLQVAVLMWSEWCNCIIPRLPLSNSLYHNNHRVTHESGNTVRCQPSEGRHQGPGPRGGWAGQCAQIIQSPRDYDFSLVPFPGLLIEWT